MARDVAVHYPFLAHLEVVGVVGPVLMVLCAQIVLVCLWALSSMAAAGRVFRRSAFRFVDVVIAALAAFAVLSLAALVLCAANDALAPGNVLVLGGGMLGSFAAALLVVIMRGLLVTATRLEQDLAEVI
nr:DUF2975 domain-containing protein [Microbacterium pseudoresistens]